jgi:hypothetical protein
MCGYFFVNIFGSVANIFSLTCLGVLPTIFGNIFQNCIQHFFSTTLFGSFPTFFLNNIFRKCYQYFSSTFLEVLPTFFLNIFWKFANIFPINIFSSTFFRSVANTFRSVAYIFYLQRPAAGGAPTVSAQRANRGSHGGQSLAAAAHIAGGQGSTAAARVNGWPLRMRRRGGLAMALASQGRAEVVMAHGEASRGARGGGGVCL